MAVLRSFTDFPQEGALIGRMVVGYTDLELDLMHCVKAVRDDLDTVFKAMYRARGESQRIEVADALGRQAYRAINLGTQFEMSLGAVKHCLKIRNQYAHAAWWNDNTGALAFANLEELAKLNDVVSSLHGLTVRHVTVALLEQQFAYFELASAQLIWTLKKAIAPSDARCIQASSKPQASTNHLHCSSSSCSERGRAQRFARSTGVQRRSNVRSQDARSFKLRT